MEVVNGPHTPTTQNDNDEVVENLRVNEWSMLRNASLSMPGILTFHYGLNDEDSNILSTCKIPSRFFILLRS